MQHLPFVLIPFLDRSFAGTAVSNYLWCCAIVLATFLLRKPVSRLLAIIAAVIARRFRNGEYGRLFRSLVRRPLSRLMTVILLFYAFSFIDEPLDRISVLHLHRKSGAIDVRLSEVLDQVFLFFIILFTTLLLSRLIDFTYRSQTEKANRTHQKERIQLLPLLKDMAKLLLWTTAFFWILGAVFHVNIPALVTGLGIGGVAIALAGKESVENLFASFTILTDKPFGAEDTIRLGDLEGKVERIGFRSTRLRSGDGSLFIIPNKKLIDENLENLSQRDTRGVKLVVNIRYGVPYDRLQAMIAELKTMVQQTLHVKDPVEVNLEQFNEKAFQVVIAYHLPQPLGSSTLPEIKQRVNLCTYDIVMKYTGGKGSVKEAKHPDDEEEDA